VIYRKQIFVTTTGDFDVVHENSHVKLGDTVQVLLGGDSPFILLRLASDEHYDNSLKTYLGPAFFRKYDGTALDTEAVLKTQSVHPYRLMGPCYLHDWCYNG
jgi:hypothetical protein